MDVIHVNPRDLRKCSINIGLYGEEVSDEFVANIKKHGVIQPLVLAADATTIVAGHRRRQAAIVAGTNRVPCIVRGDLVDPLDIEEAVIVSNEQRERTTEQRAREFAHLKKIEEERIRLNLRTGRPSTTSSVNLPSSPREVAAEKVGLGSGRNAEKAARVVEKVDELKAAGKDDEAQALRTTLNTKSVDAAHKQAGIPRRTEPKPPTTQQNAKQVLGDILKASKEVSSSIERAIKAHGGPSSHSSDAIRTLSAFNEAIAAWKADV